MRIKLIFLHLDAVCLPWAATPVGPDGGGVWADTQVGPDGGGVWAATQVGPYRGGVWAATQVGPYRGGVGAATQVGPYGGGVWAATPVGPDGGGVWADTQVGPYGRWRLGRHTGWPRPGSPNGALTTRLMPMGTDFRPAPAGEADIGLALVRRRNHKQHFLMLIMVALLSFFGPLACVLHCSLLDDMLPSGPVLFVCQFEHAQEQDVQQGQAPLPHFSPPALLPFAQLALPAFLDLPGIFSMLLLYWTCMHAQLRLRPPTPPPRSLITLS